MPPRYAYWTIIAGGLPTAFRTTEREELLPTFRRLKSRHPDANMKYFARGRLWNSPEEARVELERSRAEADARRGTRAASRGRTWRPGGDHQDPKQKFKDAKKVRNQEQRQKRFDRRHKAGAPPSDGSDLARDALQSSRAPRTKWHARPPIDRPLWDGAQKNRSPKDNRSDQGFRGKPAGAHDRPWNDRRPHTPRPPASGDRPWNNRPPRDKTPRNNRDDQGFRGKPAGSNNTRSASTKPGPRSGSKFDESRRSPKGSLAHKPAAKLRTSKPGGRPAGKPAKSRSEREPVKNRRRRS